MPQNINFRNRIRPAENEFQGLCLRGKLMEERRHMFLYAMNILFEWTCEGKDGSQGNPWPVDAVGNGSIFLWSD